MADSHPATRPGALRTELALFFVGVLVLGLAALPVRGEHVPALERGVFRFVNDLPELFYRPIWVIMQFGNGAAIAVVALIALLWRRFRLSLGLGVAGLTVYFLDKGAKLVVVRHRPPELLSDVRVLGGLATGRGYPSGHAAVAFALATIAWLWFGPRLRWFFFPLAVVVCVARVYVGAHFPLDVVGGAALGLAGGALFGVVLSVRHHGHRSRAGTAPVSPDQEG
ncbi:MAG: phosphatase PAP2 family protein, partial [Actinobacteria bacterium]|nr:phosphatase PAP2 family protein [Actinomycetota bacterium]